MVGTGENIKTGPKSDARIRTLWEALAKKSQNQRSRFCRVPERGGKAASQMGSRLPDDFPLSKYNLWCVWHSLCLLLISLSFQIKFHVRCLYLHFCELKPVVKWMYPQGGCSTKPSCSIGHITSCYHLCLFENHPLCTHWIPLMVFLAELSVFTVDGCWWTMVSSSVSSGSGLMLAFWTIASVGRGGWNTGMEKIVAGSKKDSTLCFGYKPPSKSIYIVFFLMPVLFLVQWCTGPEG